MPYVRHRSRMVQQSIYQDLMDTLIACRWMTGTTSKPVRNPADLAAAPAVLTVTDADVFPLARNNPITLIDYFPESRDEQADGTKPNTFAMDSGQPQDAVPLELGSTSMEQPYIFNFAFYAISDAAAEAVFSDLTDRYAGRIVYGDAIRFYNFASTEPEMVGYLDVDGFRYARDIREAMPSEIHLFFGELQVTDYVIDDRIESVADGGSADDPGAGEIFGGTPDATSDDVIDGGTP